MRVMRAKTARKILGYAKALPILKAAARAKVAKAARSWLFAGYEHTTATLVRPIDWTEVYIALHDLALCDEGSYRFSKSAVASRMRQTGPMGSRLEAVPFVIHAHGLDGCASELVDKVYGACKA